MNGALERVINVFNGNQYRNDHQRQHHELTKVEMEIGSSEETRRKNGHEASQNKHQPENVRKGRVDLQFPETAIFRHFGEFGEH